MSFIHDVERSIRIAVGSKANVLITGPTGTGKTRLARRIHEESERGRGPFVCVNLAALHEGTIESELFGHEKGAFTGAERKRKGLLELASGGTVLLDEIGELPLRLQARFLEFLQSKTITPVGSSVAVKLDVRVLAATHRNLSAAVSRGEFREDLFHRLRVVQIELKPIARRWGEIDRIVHECLAEVCRESGRRVLRISEDVARKLEQHAWPGNFREMRNVLEYAVHAGSGPEITLADLPEWFFVNLHEAYGASAIGVSEKDGVSAESGCSGAFGERSNCAKSRNGIEMLNFKQSMAAFEKAYLVQNLAYCGGNISRTARLIGVSKATLVRRVRHFGLKKKEAMMPARHSLLGDVEGVSALAGQSDDA